MALETEDSFEESEEFEDSLAESEQVYFDESGTVRADPVPVKRWRGPPLETKPEGQRVAAVDVNEEVLQAVEAMRGDEMVSVTFTMRDVDTDWRYFQDHKHDDAARAHFVENRQMLLDSARRPLMDWLARRGYEAEGSWLANQVRVDAPANAVREIFERSEALGISLNGEAALGAAWDGEQSTNATLAVDFHTAGFDGRAGNRSDGKAIRLGIIEFGILNRDHVGWKQKPTYYYGIPLPGPTRIKKVKQCASNPCVSEAVSGPTDYLTSCCTIGDAKHGTVVTSIAAGSIEGGQDFSFPGTNTSAQRRRSGHLPRANLYYYSGDKTWDSVWRGIDEAAKDGVDVLNLSIECINPLCSSTTNFSGINEKLAAALNAGMVPVACGGNTRSLSPNGCTAVWPGLRTETLSVNALDTSDSTVPYSATTMAASASRGGLPIRTHVGNQGTTAPIDISAPGIFRYPFGYLGTDRYDSSIDAPQCSFATPVVSAAVGAMRNAFYDIGWSSPAKALLVNMLLMSDGMDGDNPWGHRIEMGLSYYSGTGRLRSHFPTGNVGPGGWGWRSFTIHQGEWVSWPVGPGTALPQSVTQWKWAATWFEPDLQNVADIDFYVRATCGPWAGWHIAGDGSYSLRSRIDLRKSDVAGNCLEMVAYGLSVPPGGRQVWSADYYHSGSVSNH